MTIRICIQDPDYPASVSLHEALNAAGEGATSAAGAYAFVSKGGIDLLVGTPSFSQMLGKNPIQIIVGMDAITNEAAVSALLTLQGRHEGLKITAFVHDKKGTIFHPKVCWFKNDQGGVVVTGSGNLTVGGLRKNREVFSVAKVGAAEINAIEQNWHAWIESNKENLYALNSEVVSERAKLNNIRKALLLDDIENTSFVEGGQPHEVHHDVADVEKAEDLNDWSFDDNAEFFVAEIPKSGTRWKQANFTLNTFENFFGGVRGDNSRRLVLRAFYDSGEAGGLEDRPCVTVKSKNFRVELEAASGLEYPTEGRPIGVFVRVSVRMFAYYLSMPETPSNQFLEGWLKANTAGGRNVRRVVLPVKDSPEVIQQTPLYKLLKP